MHIAPLTLIVLGEDEEGRITRSGDEVATGVCQGDEAVVANHLGVDEADGVATLLVPNDDLAVLGATTGLNG